MGDLLAVVGLFVVCFLLGSIPWGVIVSRLFFHTDVRDHGSGNIGTTNSFRALGKAGGIAVFVLDFGKGLLSGLIALSVAGWLAGGTGGGQAASSMLQLLSATSFLGCVSGHIFSPWLKFKGGKGIAVAVGCMFVSFGPVAAVLELALFAVLVALTRRVSVGSIAAAAACPFLALYVFWGNWAAWALATIAALMVVWAHRANIRRLLSGEEPKIGGRSAA